MHVNRNCATGGLALSPPTGRQADVCGTTTMTRKLHASKRGQHTPRDGAHHTDFDWATDSLSAVVVTAVAAVTGERNDRMPPLNDAIDPDALDALFEPRYTGESRHGGVISFRYNDCHVTAYGDGELVVRADDGGSGT